MNLHSLPKTTIRRKKRQGQGYGSGKGGHTSGRGTKGNLARGKVPAWFEGGQLPQIRRFPFQRGKLRFKSLSLKPALITLNQLNKFAKNTEVTPKSLFELGLIRERDLKTRTVKIVSQGTLTIPLTVSVPASAKAMEKIKAAGGTITELISAKA